MNKTPKEKYSIRGTAVTIVNVSLATNNTHAMAMVSLDNMSVISKVMEQTNANTNDETTAKKAKKVKKVKDLKDLDAPKKVLNLYIFFTSKNHN